MTAPEPELTQKQRRALAALVSEPTLTRAAQAARVSEVTLYRWLRQPAFASAHSQAVGETFRAALGAVQQASQQAIQTLLDVMSDAAAAPNTRVAAARAVLDTALKAHERQEIDERLTAIEQRLAAEQGGRTDAEGSALAA